MASRASLHFAARNGRIDMITFISSEDDMDINSDDDCGYTVLELPVQGRHAESVPELLSRGDTYHDRCERFLYSLDMAAASGFAGFSTP